MIHLAPDEARILGVLVEKAQTVPAQYPITLNGLAAGASQKNNRDPVAEYSEDRVLDALDGLREKKLAVEVNLSGSRVAKYRHIARETLGLQTSELVLLAELFLRGPQSAAELRSRASRMAPLESVESVEALLAGLMSRPEPLVQKIPASRAARYAQLLSPNLHRLDEPAAAVGADSPSAPSSISTRTDLESRLTRLESEVASLRQALADLTARLQ